MKRDRSTRVEFGFTEERESPRYYVALDYVVKASCWPARPAPMCYNPDSPGYSDPGDGPECEILEARCTGIYVHEEGKDTREIKPTASQSLAIAAAFLKRAGKSEELQDAAFAAANEYFEEYLG